MTSKVIFFLFLLVLSLSIISAVEINVESNLITQDPSGIAGVEIEVPKANLINLSTSFTNSSDFANRWITNIGVLDNVNSTQHDNDGGDTLNIKESWITSLWCKLTGCTMEGELNMGTNPISNIISLSAPDGSHIAFGDNAIFSSFSGLDQAIVLSTNQSLPAGEISHALLDTRSNRVLELWQSGKNNSAGYRGNSLIIAPNNLSTNASILSNCFLVADELGKTLRVQCDTSDTGADLVVQDDIQSFGTVFADGGIRAETLVDFVMFGEDVNIENASSVHIFTPVTFEVGVNRNDEINKFDEAFTGSLGAFTNLQVDSGNWFPTTDVLCADGDCAVSIGISTVGNIIMEANISTTNANTTSLNFIYSLVNMIGSDDFTVTANNNEGSGEITLLNDGTNSVIKSVQSIQMPSSMDDKVKVSIRFECDVTQANRECFVDSINVNGTAIDTTLTNQSGFNSVIKFGSDDVDADGFPLRGIIYNASSDEIVFRGNTTFQNIFEQTINVTTSITLKSETITNWDNISLFDKNVLLVNGSRPLTGNWDAGNFNITAERFIGLVNETDNFQSVTSRNATTTNNISVFAFNTGNVTANEIDARFGLDYGAIAIGDIELFISNMAIGGLNVNGSFIIRNTDGDSDIMLALVGANNKPRWVVPKEGANFALYNSRSQMVGGNLGQAFDDGIINCTAQGYRFIDCSTSATGADLGLQDDFEFHGSLFGGNGTWNVSDDGNIISAGNITASTGFFTFLGSLASKITSIWTTNIFADTGNFTTVNTTFFFMESIGANSCEAFLARNGSECRNNTARYYQSGV